MLQVVTAILVTAIISGAVGFVLAAPELLVLGIIEMMTVGQSQVDVSLSGKLGLFLLLLGIVLTLSSLLALVIIAF